MSEIDLTKPGKLTASGQNAKDYTFYIFKDGPGYTKAALEANPNCIAAKDMILKSPPVPDSGGNCQWDMKPMARDLRQKLTDLFTPVRVAVLGSSKDSNHNPKKKLADLQDYMLARGVPELKLTAELGALPVPEKIGMKVEFKNMDSVNLKVDPAGPVTLSKTTLTQPEVVTITAAKDGKVKITATEIESIGYNVALTGCGYTPA